MAGKTQHKTKPARRLYSRIAPPKIPQLPLLSAPPKDGHRTLTITMIQVYDNPWYRRGTGTHWITAMKPARPVGEDDLICLAINRDRRTGVGRITHIANMDKHWITYHIAGATPRAYVRVPVPWAKLTVRTADTHAKSFHSLENVPPHYDFRANPLFRDPSVNPYLPSPAMTTMYAQETPARHGATPPSVVPCSSTRSEDKKDENGRTNRRPMAAEVSS